MTTKEIIVESATKMFVSQGIKAVRMDDIARELSISKRTLYELFGDKEELIYQSIKHYTQQLKVRRDELTANVNNPLEAMIVSLRDMIVDAPVSCRLRRNISRFYPAVYERLEKEMQSESRNKLSQWVKVCVEQGYFTKTADCDFVVRVLHDSAGGVIGANNFENNDHLEQVSMITYSLVIFIRGLCTVEGIEVIDNCFNKYIGNLPKPKGAA
jgi:AcrR family transcriptional regulator